MVLISMKFLLLRWSSRSYSSYARTTASAFQTKSPPYRHNELTQRGPAPNFPSKVQEANQTSERFEHGLQLPRKRIGNNISSREKNKFFVDVLNDLKDSKEDVYGALDAWVAWEREFPLAALKRALLSLEKDEQWHRIIQVLKWMLSKGQGNTMGTYAQLIKALDKDGRPEEAHHIWVRKISYDLHSVPWSVCKCMISIYYRNNMLERLVKLFKGLEEYDRKPPIKSIVRKVSDAYEILGMFEEKDRVLEKYNYLFSEKQEGSSKRRKKRKNNKNEPSTVDDQSTSSS